jgi:hypothetical protein
MAAAIDLKLVCAGCWSYDQTELGRCSATSQLASPTEPPTQHQRQQQQPWQREQAQAAAAAKQLEHIHMFEQHTCWRKFTSWHAVAEQDGSITASIRWG